MTVGILGANGFVGSNLCCKFLKEGCKVYAIYNQHYNNIPTKCVKIRKNENIDDTLDCLLIAVGNYASEHNDMIYQLFNIAKIIDKLSFEKIIFISSVSVYGNHSGIIDVNSAFNNPSLYGQLKLAQEFILKSVKKISIIRPTYLYGELMNSNSLIPYWINCAKNKKLITVKGDGFRCQDYLHIDDLTILCYLISNSDINSTVIAATGNSISNIDIANTIKELIPGTSIEFQGIDFTESYKFDISETTRLYNWKPATCLKNELQKMIIK